MKHDEAQTNVDIRHLTFVLHSNLPAIGLARKAPISYSPAAFLHKERDMLRTSLWISSLVVGLVLALPAAAAPPWATLVPFKRIDADPNKSYELTEAEGPWMIMCTSFAGPTAEQQAQDLVIELRRKLRLEAYTFRRTFDFTDTTDGIGWNRFGEQKRMRYLNQAKFEEIAVLVGNYGSVDHPDLERALDVIKHAAPATLGEKYREKSSQRFAGLRTIYRKVTLDPENKQKGPMGAAFVTKNPLLPEEYFHSQGLDKFIADINQMEFSLLKCPGKYTVRVATFRGVDTMKPAEFERMTTAPREMAKIDQAAIKASKLCAALRAKGIEAYEFHDRTESIVTIGSFADYGSPRADGKTEINPAMHRIMEEFGPRETKLANGTIGLAPRLLDGIPFDPQPWPVQVPRESIAAAYNQSKSLYR
jgi:hypothetical protein